VTSGVLTTFALTVTSAGTATTGVVVLYAGEGIGGTLLKSVTASRISKQWSNGVDTFWVADFGGISLAAGKYTASYLRPEQVPQAQAGSRRLIFGLYG